MDEAYRAPVLTYLDRVTVAQIGPASPRPGADPDVRATAMAVHARSLLSDDAAPDPWIAKGDAVLAADLAYALARKHFDPDGINRVILATDGDFHVGPTCRRMLERFTSDEKGDGIALTVLGVGDDLEDSGIEGLAASSNGNYAYLDSLDEARKVLRREAGGTLVTIAKDVKIQVAFDPVRVGRYRLLGYRNRALADEDFDQDLVDGGEIGSGHTVTALYEIALRPDAAAGELFTVSVRHTEPGETKSRLLEVLVSLPESFDGGSDDLRFAAAVATFGLVLRDSPFTGRADLALACDLAQGAIGDDPHGDRVRFLALIARAVKIRANGSW